MKKITLLKPITAAFLLAASLIAIQSCRKTEKLSPSVPELPFAVATSVVPSEPLFVSTAAGDGTTAQFNLPSGVATDALGNVYIADMANHRIRKITAAGVVSTFAGSGNATYQDGTGTAASFNTPSSVATDANRNVYVADKNNHLIRKITPDGTVTIFAGGVNMPGNSEGPGAVARFNYPAGVAVDTSGNILVADSGNHKIRRITPDGVVSTYAGSGTRGTGNGPTVFSQFNGPVGVTVDVSGNVFVADAGNNKIRKIAGGVVSTLAGGGAGDEYGFVNETGVSARFNNPTGVVADGAGNVYVADKLNHAIRRITPAGVVTTVSGNGTAGLVNDAAALARFSSPAGIAIDAAGKLFVADQNNQRIRGVGVRIITVSTFAGAAGAYGRIDGAASAARFFYPAGLTSDASGITIAEHGNCDVRFISFSTLQVSTTVGFQGIPGYQNGFFQGALFNGPTGAVYVPSRSSLFVADRLNNSIRQRTGFYVYGYAGSNLTAGFRDAQYSNALFNAPSSIVADAAGYLYVADQNNHRIRKIDLNGNVTTLAGSGVIGAADGVGSSAQFNYPYGLTIDAAGNLYVADVDNHKIRKVTPSGVVSTVAGSGISGFVNGPGAQARFNYPYGVAVDAAGNLYVADSQNNAIRMITPAGEVSTLAGTGAADYRDGDGSVAMFKMPLGITVDANGNIYTSDFYNHVIRKITIQ
jgi:sugar lactone lactonase YvrE